MASSSWSRPSVCGSRNVGASTSRWWGHQPSSPLEIHEILAKVTWLRVSALVINLFAIAYLLWTKRLFGLRGGHAAFVAERHNDSLLEVERSASREEAITR